MLLLHVITKSQSSILIFVRGHYGFKMLLVHQQQNVVFIIRYFLFYGHCGFKVSLVHWHDRMMCVKVFLFYGKCSIKVSLVH